MDPKLVLKTCVFCVLFVMTLGMYMIFDINVHCIFYVINYQCQTEIDTKHPLVKGIRICPIDGARPFPRGNVNPLNCCSLTYCLIVKLTCHCLKLKSGICIYLQV